MVALCKNRPEGFGPLSTLHPPTLTSCFLDTVLLPLCTWLYLVFIALLLPLLIALLPRRRLTHPPSPPRRTKTYRALTILYALLLTAQVLMTILEIVRLALADLGIGLLPFVPLAIIVAGGMHFITPARGASREVERRRSVGWRRGANGALWVGLMVVSGVKIAGEVREGVGTRGGDAVSDGG